MRRKTMAQHVRGQRHAEARFLSVSGQYFPDANSAQRASPSVDKYCRASRCLVLTRQLWARFPHITIYNRQRLLPYGNDSFLVALSDAPQTTGLGVEVHHTESG